MLGSKAASEFRRGQQRGVPAGVEPEEYRPDGVSRLPPASLSTERPRTWSPTPRPSGCICHLTGVVNKTGRVTDSGTLTPGLASVVSHGPVRTSESSKGWSAARLPEGTS
jgi:hypothetical protein